MTLAEQWHKKIEGWKQSQLSGAMWCRQNNEKPHVFYYWKEKFAPECMQKRDFHDIDSTVSQGTGIRIDIHGIHLLLERDFDTHTLHQCVQALRGLPC